MLALLTQSGRVLVLHVNNITTFILHFIPSNDFLLALCLLNHDFFIARAMVQRNHLQLEFALKFGVIYGFPHRPI